MKILILGVNGFIGNRLTKAILEQTDWQIDGLDIANSKLEHSLSNKNFHFLHGDVKKHQQWVEERIKLCDVVLPLIAIATPATYVTDPLRVFELDFESNLPIIRLALKHNTRLIFPSTSEVYGMCDEEEFHEESSKLTQGPIHKERWIYSCCKQLLDRIIYAYGNHDKLDFTLFRPFNWIGPTQDDIESAQQQGGVRVITQFISNIIYAKDLQIVDDGQQKRSFTYIDDGIAALIKIIENKNRCASGRIFNIGNPHNNVTIKELAETILDLAKDYPRYNKVNIVNVDSADYYGKNYQDVPNRVPSIANAHKYLNWQPKTDFKTAIRNTLEFYLNN